MKVHSWKLARAAALTSLVLGAASVYAQTITPAKVAFLMPDQSSTRYEQHDRPGLVMRRISRTKNRKWSSISPVPLVLPMSRVEFEYVYICGNGGDETVSPTEASGMPRITSHESPL